MWEVQPSEASIQVDGKKYVLIKSGRRTPNWQDVFQYFDGLKRVQMYDLETHMILEIDMRARTVEMNLDTKNARLNSGKSDL